MVDTPTTMEPQPRPLESSLNGHAATVLPVAATAGGTATTISTVAIVGLGYVGLPTGIALADAGFDVIGIDVSERRVADIREGSADLLPDDQERLTDVLAAERFVLTCAADALSDADAVLICVPTPVDEDRRPDLCFLASACETVVEQARLGQLIVLTSTSYVGTTRELLAAPLARRGLEPGTAVHVAFSPERIDPGNSSWRQEGVPRVVGGVTPECTRVAGGLIEKIAARVHPVTSPEAAVNGLWAAYSANNQVAAQRFASPDVIRVLFESPYDGEQGTFQGCRPNVDIFDCDYLQPSTRYAMTVKTDPANGFVVVELTVAPR